ncbi:hypothetical protein BST45_07855 [Mycobacterium shinjukuense]|uniref:Uncharacterized protein n=1 Tax=Mycobacterium shinjukuense TaxID=398694 RepID=A0A7I7MVS2_9MYCO|nr:hypothetical protein BST45_07855 [Mycobacterium shinjukuense]BBX75962.1 hypothetical protein MSHI_38680 [Mycobacterium shinjukuense]
MGGKLAHAIAEWTLISRAEAARRIGEAADLGPRRALTGQPLAPVLAASAAAQRAGKLGAGLGAPPACGDPVCPVPHHRCERVDVCLRRPAPHAATRGLEHPHQRPRRDRVATAPRERSDRAGVTGVPDSNCTAGQLTHIWPQHCNLCTRAQSDVVTAAREQRPGTPWRLSA